MPDGQKPKILVIDDDDLVRATIVAVLERADVEVTEAEDGSVGMRLFEESVWSTLPRRLVRRYSRSLLMGLAILMGGGRSLKAPALSRVSRFVSG